MGLRTWVVAIALAVAAVGSTSGASLADDPPPVVDPILLELTPLDLLPIIITYSTVESAEEYETFKLLRYLYIVLGGDPALLPDDPNPADGNP
jgi:hypothetical protein